VTGARSQAARPPLRGVFAQHRCEAARLVPLELIAMTIGRSLMIFDVEGTLVDSTSLTLRCWQETLQSFGFEFPLTTLHRHSGQDPHDMLRELLPGRHVTRVLGRIIEMQGQRYREKYLPQVTAFTDVRPLFERVKGARGRIALATSASADELDHYLALLGVGDLVDAVACGDDVQHDKPDSALIEVALLRAGKVTPAEAVMIGDSPYDAIAAKHAHVRAIGLLSGGFSRSELDASGCAAVYRDPADLLAHYEDTVRLVA
jgi:phosphoglycolate phosphatase-like HAD superfamily hydrolase